jgi:uncharacterized RDD family membrane protein YckC
MSKSTLHKPAQLTLDHLRVDEKLQHARLAGFSRRTMAFGIDWLIILLCTEFFGLLVPLALVFLLIRKRLGTGLVKSRRILKKNISFADHKLEQMAIDVKLRRRFRRYMTAYLYVIIYLPIVLAGLALVSLAVSIFSIETYETAKASVSGPLSGLFRPITDLSNAFALLLRFFGAFVYFTLFTWQWRGSTPGKRLAGIQVVRLNGRPLTLWGSLERASGYTASAALLALGFLQFFWDPNRQTTHDKITETIVIRA